MLETKEKIDAFEEEIKTHLLACAKRCEEEELLIYASAFIFMIGFLFDGPKGMRAAAEALEKAAITMHPFLNKSPENNTLQ